MLFILSNPDERARWLRLCRGCGNSERGGKVRRMKGDLVSTESRVAQTLKNARRKLRFWNFRGERFGKLERKIVVRLHDFWNF